MDQLLEMTNDVDYDPNEYLAQMDEKVVAFANHLEVVSGEFSDIHL